MSFCLKRNVPTNADDEYANKRQKVASGTSHPVISTTSGLLALPVELFENICDELLIGLRPITREDTIFSSEYLKGAEFTSSAGLLRPLVQTCRALRAAYLARYYEHIEVCICRHSGVHWYQELSRRLQKISEGLIGFPALAKHVRKITVSLTSCDADTVFPLFARCLSQLPNLHTLRILFTPSKMTTPLRDAFSQYKYPQIRTIILPSCAHAILRSCPEVRDVTCNSNKGSTLLSTIFKDCPHVEVIDGVDWTEKMQERLLKVIPNLRALHLRAGDKINAFQGLKQISHISISFKMEMGNRSKDITRNIDVLEESSRSLLDQAKIVLENSSVGQGKFVRLIYMVPDPDKGTYYRPAWKAVRTKRVDV